jgi:hypothetical protein
MGKTSRPDGGFPYIAGEGRQPESLSEIDFLARRTTYKSSDVCNLLIPGSGMIFSERLSRSPGVSVSFGTVLGSTDRLIGSGQKSFGDGQLTLSIGDDRARAHVKHERQRHGQNGNNEHGALQADGAENFRHD